MSKKACSAVHTVFVRHTPYVFPGSMAFLIQVKHSPRTSLWEVSLTDAILHRDSLRPHQQSPFQLLGLVIQAGLRSGWILFSLRAEGKAACIFIWLSSRLTAKKNCLYRNLDYTLMTRCSVHNSDELEGCSSAVAINVDFIMSHLFVLIAPLSTLYDKQ